MQNARWYPTADLGIRGCESHDRRVNNPMDRHITTKYVISSILLS